MSDASSSFLVVVVVIAVLDPSRNNARRVRGARALLLASAFPLAHQLFDFVHDSDGDESLSHQIHDANIDALNLSGTSIHTFSLLGYTSNV